MKVLVTGGAGYIGSVTVERLIAADFSVVVLDNLSQGHAAAIHPAATFVEADLQDPDAIEGVFAEHAIEAVMHFASRTLVGESMQKPFLYLGENVVCGRNLLECMLRHDVKRFVLSSTANLFDSPKKSPSQKTNLFVRAVLMANRNESLSGCSTGLNRLMGYASQHCGISTPLVQVRIAEKITRQSAT